MVCILFCHLTLAALSYLELCHFIINNFRLSVSSIFSCISDFTVCKKKYLSAKLVHLSKLSEVHIRQVRFFLLRNLDLIRS